MRFQQQKKKTLLIDWNNTTCSYPKEKNLIQLIEEQVSKDPEKIAIIFEEKAFTYGELNVWANQVAHHIQRLLLKPHSYVVVYLERSIEAIICFLAILKAGHAYVPIDVKSPLKMTQEIIEDCKAPLVITISAFKNRLQETTERLNTIIFDIDALKDEKIEEKVKVESDQSCPIAYVLYTSGSTGKPKGVQVKHQSLLNILWAMHQEINFTSQDVLLAVTPLTFDLSVPDLYLPLITGASFVLASDSDRFNPYCIIENIHKYRITIMQGTPTTWQMLVNVGWKNETHVKIVCGGEALSTDLALKLRESSDAPFWNFYGPTETTVWSMCYKVDTIDKTKPTVSIGRPLANTQVYILDSNQALCPIGVPGELYIGGVGVAQGYINNPELTAQRFLPDKFSREPHQMFYRTGDSVVWSSNGEMHFISRMDNQIKIRGHRIEADAIESLLIQHERITQCVVLDKSPTSDQELTAYLRITSKEASWESIRNYLALHLPSYMIPTKFVVLNQFPLTSTGKINKKIFPTLTDFYYLSPMIEVPTAVTTEYEKMIVDMIKRLLYLGDVNLNSNFFDLGMHSLLLTEFAYELSKSLKREINVIDIFSYPSVKSLAAFLNKEIQTNIAAIQQRAAAKKTKGLAKKRRDYVQ